MDHKIPHDLRPLCHHQTRWGGGGLIHYPAHDDVPMATDGDDISIHTIAEMEKYGSLRHRQFAHTHPPNYWLEKTLRRGSDDSSDGWMTLQPCERKCKHPLTHRPARTEQRLNETRLLGFGMTETPEVLNTIMVGNSLSFLMVY
jgi:hypothetical protein